MALLTIGDFARASGLTPKALRLYDESGLLAPAAVDSESGYRLYDQSQLVRARLIAQLRGVGMPLAEVRVVCGLEPVAAAEAVGAYWRRVTVDTEARARQVAILVDRLTGRDANMSLNVRFACGCDTGAGRDSNEDAAYASDRLFAVADGMRGPGGQAASAAAIDALKPLEQSDASAVDLLAGLAGAVTEADRTVRALASEEHRPITTLTAMLRRGSHLALVHIGDTRAYVLRGGELSQLTRDHTWVQSQLDQELLDGREAAAHPQRALLLRALGAGPEQVEADLAMRTALAGDRYLLCSDGLSAVVDRAALRAVLSAGDDPEQTVRRLIDLGYDAGAPDNMACVVADVSAG